MKQLKKLATFLAAATVVTVAGAQEVNNWRNASGEVWKNAFGQCWRNASWTPATAAPGCDGAIAPPAGGAIAPSQPGAAVAGVQEAFLQHWPNAFFQTSPLALRQLLTSWAPATVTTVAAARNVASFLSCFMLLLWGT